MVESRRGGSGAWGKGCPLGVAEAGAREGRQAVRIRCHCGGGVGRHARVSWSPCGLWTVTRVPRGRTQRHRRWGETALAERVRAAGWYRWVGRLCMIKSKNPYLIVNKNIIVDIYRKMAPARRSSGRTGGHVCARRSSATSSPTSVARTADRSLATGRVRRLGPHRARDHANRAGASPSPGAHPGLLQRTLPPGYR